MEQPPKPKLMSQMTYNNQCNERNVIAQRQKINELDQIFKDVETPDFGKSTGDVTFIDLTKEDTDTEVEEEDDEVTDLTGDPGEEDFCRWRFDQDEVIEIPNYEYYIPAVCMYCGSKLTPNGAPNGECSNLKCFCLRIRG